MINSGVEHKLRVFISSRCGGKYTIARKALKAMLEATGLIESYVFETEPASSEDTISAYLESVDNSNLCIFLVDNADNVSPAVLSEEKRAKDKGLRLLYLFCDETEKEPTPMQKEIRQSMSCQYHVVHEFSDMVARAYDSVLQDLIKIYRKKDERVLDIESDNQSLIAQTSFSPHAQGTYSLQKERFHFSLFVTQTLKSDIFPFYYSEEELQPSKLEELLAKHLNVVLNRDAFDDSSFNALKEAIIEEQDSTVKGLVERRLEAQLFFFQAKYDECLSALQDALKLAINNNAIPSWLAIDVAIDIRYIIIQIDDYNNRITIGNPGQKYIDESDEPVFYPYLDRHVGNMQEEIAKHYYTELTVSPYTSQFSGFDSMSESLASAFCIAQMHGSIVQTIICKDRLVAILSMLCTMFDDDHDYVKELIRLLVINQDCEKLDALIRTYNQSVAIINGADVRAILNSISFIPDQLRMYKSKYLLTSRFGYYMDEKTYAELYSCLTNYAITWAKNEHLIISLSTYVFDFFKKTVLRANLEMTMDFVFSIFESGNTGYYMNCFEVLRTIDYSSMSVEYQRRTRTFLSEILSGRIKCESDLYFYSFCTRFCKTATIPIKQIEKSIAKKHPNYYNDTLRLEMSQFSADDPAIFITRYLEIAESRTESQRKHGGYTQYSFEPFDVIFNIISISNYQIINDLLNDVVNTAISTLSESRQIVSAKTAAIRLLQLLYKRTNNDKLWNSVKQDLIDNKDIFSSGFEIELVRPDTTSVLTILYDLFLSCFDSKSDNCSNQVIADVLTLNQRDSLSIIKCLEYMSSYLENDVGALFNKRILETFLNFSVIMIQHRERDIKYNATRCLVGLAAFDTTRDIVLTQLSKIMDKGSQEAKIAILSRIKKSPYKEEPFVEQIFNKGRADSNFIVRYVAEREYKKEV